LYFYNYKISQILSQDFFCKMLEKKMRQMENVKYYTIL
jgi:hypothetical protein